MTRRYCSPFRLPAGGALRALIDYLLFCSGDDIFDKNIPETSSEDPDLLPNATVIGRLNAIQQSSEGGRRLLGLFNDHAEELAGIERSDLDLRWKAYRTVSSFFPGFAYVGVGRGAEQIFSRSMADQALDLWENVKQKASPTLAAGI